MRAACGQRQLGSYAEMLASDSGVTPEMAVRLAKLNDTRAGMAIIADMLRDVSARHDAHVHAIQQPARASHGALTEAGDTCGPQQHEMIDRPPAETREEWIARRQHELAAVRAAVSGSQN